ncbi:MAG: histidine phosphatase family protein [Bacilli bacterium]|nr:histidine phosphatase family protein [Bacilli bacterium]
MTKFILVRHTSPNYLKVFDMDINKYYATAFAPLSKKGKDDALILSENEIFNNSDIMISSPFTRTLETANIINKHNLDLIVEPGLHEWLPDINKEYFNDYYNNIGPFESLKSIKKRSLSVLEKYLNYNKVIVVSHRVVIYSLTNMDTKMGEFHEIEMDKNKIKVKR